MKKLLVLLFAILMAFSFFACDNDTPAPGDDTDNGNEEIVAPIPTKGDISKELFDRVDELTFIFESPGPEAGAEIISSIKKKKLNIILVKHYLQSLF